jgi:hypothetical protein
MATGIQGVQGPKGARGVQGATGWGAIGSDTGPTGPTGPIGWFTNQIIQESTQIIILSAADVSALYRVQSGTQGATREVAVGDVSEGGFFVFTNQTGSGISISPASGGNTIDGFAIPAQLPTGSARMFIRTTATNLVSSYPYSGVWAGTGYIEDVPIDGG